MTEHQELMSRLVVALKMRIPTHFGMLPYEGKIHYVSPTGRIACEKHAELSCALCRSGNIPSYATFIGPPASLNEAVRTQLVTMDFREIELRVAALMGIPSAFFGELQRKASSCIASFKRFEETVGGPSGVHPIPCYCPQHRHAPFKADGPGRGEPYRRSGRRK